MCTHNKNRRWSLLIQKDVIWSYEQHGRLAICVTRPRFLYFLGAHASNPELFWWKSCFTAKDPLQQMTTTTVSLLFIYFVPNTSTASTWPADINTAILTQCGVFYTGLPRCVWREVSRIEGEGVSRFQNCREKIQGFEKCAFFGWRGGVECPFWGNFCAKFWIILGKFWFLGSVGGPTFAVVVVGWRPLSQRKHVYATCTHPHLFVKGHF